MGASPAIIPEVTASIAALRRSINLVICGKERVVDLALTSVLAGGHLLLEDVPGVGKTTLAASLARAIGGTFSRVQLTADLLPSDLLGGIQPDPTGAFVFREGPVFANVVLADELNRTSPRTQSALFEAMEEGQVSIEGVTRSLPSPFTVIATQNPLEHHGTFPLPDSQLDRFLIRTGVGYPGREYERQVLRAGAAARANGGAAISLQELAELVRLAREVHVAASLEDWILDLVAATRSTPLLARGVSTRGAQALYRASKAFALLNGRSFVIPEDVRALVVPVLAHRVQARDTAVGGVDPARAAVATLRDALPPPG